MSLVLADVQPTENPKITEITVLEELEGMTNGEVIKALFPNANYESCQNFMQITSANICGSTLIWEEWWNAPYKAEREVKPND